MTANPTLAPDDREAIAQTVLRFFRLVDQGRAGETAALFTPDASITFGPGSPKPGTIAGPVIAEAMAARERQTEVTTRHVVTNFDLTPEADGSVGCYSLLTLYRSEDETRSPVPRSIADVNDRLIRDGNGGWRIAERLITPIFGLA